MEKDPAPSALEGPLNTLRAQDRQIGTLFEDLVNLSPGRKTAQVD
jgi:hypothetical protein